MRSHNYSRSLVYHVCLVGMPLLSLAPIKTSTNYITVYCEVQNWFMVELIGMERYTCIIISSLELVIYLNTHQYYATMVL